MNDLTFEGVTQSIREWCLDYGITPRLLRNRIKAGWPVERAITTPMRAMPGDRLDDDAMNLEPGRTSWGRKLHHDGASRTIFEWSQIIGIDKNVIQSRIRGGWSDAEAIETPLFSRFGPRSKRKA